MLVRGGWCAAAGLRDGGGDKVGDNFGISVGEFVFQKTILCPF